MQKDTLLHPLENSRIVSLPEQGGDIRLDTPQRFVALFSGVAGAGVGAGEALAPIGIAGAEL